MGVVYRFLATEDEAGVVADWFRSQSPAPIEHAEDGNFSFYFQEFGRLADDARKSPLATAFIPVRKRDVLLTCGEVHFLATPMTLFPQLDALSRAFRRWLSRFTRVFSRSKSFMPEWDYYLEGSIKNYDSDVYALPHAMEALRQGHYFVANGDNDSVLEGVCRELRKRGVRGVA